MSGALSVPCRRTAPFQASSPGKPGTSIVSWPSRQLLRPVLTRARLRMAYGSTDFTSSRASASRPWHEQAQPPRRGVVSQSEFGLHFPWEGASMLSASFSQSSAILSQDDLSVALGLLPAWQRQSSAFFRHRSARLSAIRIPLEGGMLGAKQGLALQKSGVQGTASGKLSGSSGSGSWAVSSLGCSGHWTARRAWLPRPTDRGVNVPGAWTARMVCCGEIPPLASLPAAHVPQPATPRCRP